MFDFGIGYTELLVIAVVAIIVIGPKDLPKVLRAFGRTMAKVRGMAREFQGHLDAAMRESGLDEVRREVQSIRSINPVADVAADLKQQETDFKKSFSALEGTTSEPVKQAEPQPENTKTSAANDFDKYFAKPASPVEP
jgi:sec-independent protein translocase protein TatB